MTLALLVVFLVALAIAAALALGLDGDTDPTPQAAPHMAGRHRACARHARRSPRARLLFATTWRAAS